VPLPPGVREGVVSRGSKRPAPVIVAAFVAGAGLVSPLSSQVQTVPPGVAYRIVDLQTNEVVAQARPDVLGRRGAPGSVVKMAVLLAALDSGVVGPDTRIDCSGSVVVEGRQVTCTHPSFHRPLTLVEALGHSCNTYVATIARRLTRGAFDRALVAFGLHASDTAVPLPLAALGLAGVEATPVELLGALARLRAQGFLSGYRSGHREVIERGLRLAAAEGTASALGGAGFDALAKTGTAPAAGGRYQGLVVAVTLAAHPVRGVVVVLAGAAGRDAAAVAGELLRQHAPSVRPASASLQLPAVVRVGRVTEGRVDVQAVPLEDYVARVVAGEASRDTPAAALETFAIAARTYAAANPGRHRAEGFDLCDLTHCQLMGSVTEPARRAAAATAGQVLVFDGRPASVFYTASCGGVSERPADIWPGAANPPYLVRREDPFCRIQPAWTSEMSVDALTAALKAAGFRGERLEALGVVERTASGRVALLSVTGLVPEEISGDGFRLAIGRAAGWQRLKSTAFELVRTARGYRFSGRGSGHGVGLCMASAIQMAAGGHTALSILSEFFPGAEVQSAAVTRAAPPATPIEIRLPGEDEGERDLLTGLVGRAVEALARSLDTPAPARLRLTFHPTVASYQRATGQPWWTSAASRGHEIHLIPLAHLRDRRTVDQTLRHEIVHVLTLPALAGRPAWVREGLAVYFAGESGAPAARPQDAPPCPSDRELMQAESPDALQRAYQSAAACVANALAAGMSWSQIRDRQ